MKWKKLGHVYKPDGTYSWAVSHAANPVAVQVDGDLYRIYFSSRDSSNRSSIAYVVVDLKNPTTVIEHCKKPVLTMGDLGMPDDSGVSIGCIVDFPQGKYLYYMGWNLSVTVPWKNTIGLAIGDNGGNEFKRYSRFPIMDLNEIDPYTISYPWVMKDNGKYRMWYGSNLKWGAEKKDMLHVIKYAESDDGIKWHRSDIISIESKGPHDYAICKPCVIKDKDVYRMWYCHRGEKYRIGYAESKDGIRWNRKDEESGIDVSPEGWDSDMIEYPFVFDHNGKRFMLYSGEAFGASGFGIAVME